MSDWKKQYRKAITFSYDDGVEQDIRLLDILNAHHLKATWNVNTGLDYTHGTWKYKDRLWVHRLNLPDCATLYQGHEIAVHGRGHQNLTELTQKDRLQELGEDAAAIATIFQQNPVGMAYAYGAYNDAVIADATQLHLRYARGVKSSHCFDVPEHLMYLCPTCHHNDEQLFDLAKRFLEIQPDTPQIFYLWGHSYEFEGEQNWERIERFCDMIAGKDDIFYGTNAEVLL